MKIHVNPAGNVAPALDSRLVSLEVNGFIRIVLLGQVVFRDGELRNTISGALFHLLLSAMGIIKHGKEGEYWRGNIGGGGNGHLLIDEGLVKVFLVTG